MPEPSLCVEVDVFTRLYPCRECAEHFGEIVRYGWISQPDCVCTIAALSLPFWDANMPLNACKWLVKKPVAVVLWAQRVQS